uniref:Uncharacterized protein n=1 Tax=Pararge aegeria TaxID=116150 RepID=S4NW76_9NEOP
MVVNLHATEKVDVDPTLDKSHSPTQILFAFERFVSAVDHLDTLVHQPWIQMYWGMVQQSCILRTQCPLNPNKT